MMGYKLYLAWECGLRSGGSERLKYLQIDSSSWPSGGRGLSLVGQEEAPTKRDWLRSTD